MADVVSRGTLDAHGPSQQRYAAKVSFSQEAVPKVLSFDVIADVTGAKNRVDIAGGKHCLRFFDEALRTLAADGKRGLAIVSSVSAKNLNRYPDVRAAWLNIKGKVRVSSGPASITREQSIRDPQISEQSAHAAATRLADRGLTISLADLQRHESQKIESSDERGPVMERGSFSICAIMSAIVATSDIYMYEHVQPGTRSVWICSSGIVPVRTSELRH